MEAENGTLNIPKKTRTSSSRSSRKQSLPHEGVAKSNGTIGRRHTSVATIAGRVRSWWSRRNQTSTSPTMIPRGILPDEKAAYETLIKVVESRRITGVKPPRIFVITDLAKDYDDLAAMIVLKELNRLGVVELVGFIANLEPAEKRAQFGRGALDSLGLRDILIATGTSGFPLKRDKKHNVLDYEFKCSFMADPNDPRLKKAGKGADFLKEKCEEAVASGQKLTILLISSLEDIFTFSENNPDLLRKAVSNFVLQGGYTFSDEQKLEPEVAAANNRYDMEAAKSFHRFMQESEIPSAVYTKVAAFATPLYSELFDEMGKTGHPVGIHLRDVQVAQDTAFYETSCKENPLERFAPFMNQEWFLRNKTSWFDQNPAPGTPYPKGLEVVPYLTKVIIYDALAALGTSGEDTLDALKVLTDTKTEPTSIHRIVGFAGPPSDTGIVPDQMATVLSALMKGALVTCEPAKEVE